MKWYFNIFVGMLMCLFMSMLASCENNENDDDIMWGGDWSFLTQDGSLISRMTLRDYRCPFYSDTEEPYVIYGYKGLKLRLFFEQDYLVSYIKESAPGVNVDDVVRQIVKYESGKRSFILKDCERFKSKYSYSLEEFGAFKTIYYYAYIDGAPTITCDKTLFGLAPGTNLSNHIQIDNDGELNCIPTGIDNPKLLYKFGDELPDTMDKYFSDKSWIQRFYYLKFIDIPAEEYDELTFHVTFPMILEHTVDYAIDLCNGLRPERKFTKRVFESECKVLIAAKPFEVYK